ncbi:hypothetical protein MSKU9_0602 [Komagataeibacter diospyri]|uniref:Uncharacterized protein n=2 Tax=Komagataeibacter diospyri TaxID=1932662 RepID=A0A4P5NRP2_9PROT|nr:hypothetical protein MSKU9_0602 [Komagataeibacter diospyri]
MERPANFLIKMKNYYRELGQMFGPDFVAKSFVIAFVFEGLMITVITQPSRLSHPFTIVMTIAMYTIGSLLFLFTKAGWEAFKDLFASNSIVFMPALFRALPAFLVNAKLWTSSIFLETNNDPDQTGR